MKRLLFLVLIGVFSVNLAFAQEAKRSYTGPTQNPKTTKKSTAKTNQTTGTTKSKGEIYVGYSGTVAQTNTGGGFVGERKVHHGAQTSVTFYANRFVGLRGDFSVGYKDNDEAFGVPGRITTVTRRTSIYNVLGGIQIKDSESEAAVQPFGHALVGVGIYRQSLRNCVNSAGGFCGTTVRGSGLAGAFGGGFDVKVASRAGIRLMSDYNPMRIEKQTINNFRFGVGVVFK